MGIMLVPKEKKSSINGGITVDPGKVRVPNPHAPLLVRL